MLQRSTFASLAAATLSSCFTSSPEHVWGWQFWLLWIRSHHILRARETPWCPHGSILCEILHMIACWHQGHDSLRVVTVAREASLTDNGGGHGAWASSRFAGMPTKPCTWTKR